MEKEIRSSIETVLRIILKYQPISRAKIAKQCGLSKVTVSECAEWLLKQQIIEEQEATEVIRGRPPVMLLINRSAGVIVAIEADKITSKIGIADLNGQLIRWEALPLIDDDPHKFVDTVSRHLQAIRQEFSACPLGVVGVGFAIIGSFDQERGVIEYVANQASWNAYPFRMEMTSLNPDMPFLVGRQAQMSALGEAAFGGLQITDRLACLSSSWGLGVGLYTEYKGPYLAPEQFTRFGHTTIQYKGRLCTCGNRGCLEEYVSVRTLIAQIYPKELPQMELFRDIQTRLRTGDPYVRAVFGEMCQYMVVGIANLINAYTPRHVCVTGLLSELLDDSSFKGIQTGVMETVTPAYRKSLQLSLSKLGELSVIYGCFANVRENLASLVLHQPD